MGVKLIIDTDAVADDIRAISLALQHPDVEVIAFTITHGCVSVEQAVANVCRAQRANNVKKPIPIFKGASGPLLKRLKPHGENFFFGQDGIGDQPEVHPERENSDFSAAEKEKAALALIRLTAEHPDATLVCIGPLTNIAVALKLEPEFATQPKNMVIMGGNYYGIGNVDSSTSAEFNFHGDPEAASIVLSEMQVPITVVPWEAFFLEGHKHEKIVDFHAHLLHGTPLSSFLYAITSVGRGVLARNNRQFSYCDEIAMAVAINPEKVIRKHRPFRVQVELSGRLTRGQVVVDWVDVLWCDEDHDLMKEGFGKEIDRSNGTVDFVTSYNVEVVDKWMHAAVKGDREW